MGAAGAFLHGRILSSSCVGRRHPDRGLNRGRYDWARCGPPEAAAINERARGPDHPSVGLALNDLAEL